MTGTIVNAVAVIIGGLIGMLLKKGISERLADGINKALGVAVLVIGINGVVTSMITVEGGALKSSGELLLVVSLVLGTLFGTALKLHDRLEGVSGKIEAKLHLTGFAQGFVNATTIFCVGAMAIIGALNDGLTGDSSVLFVKSALDFVTSIILGASLGIGVACSAVAVFVYQGAIALLAGLLQNVLAGELLNQICMTGYAIIMCIGFNFFGGGKFKTLNMLPALIVPILYKLVLWGYNAIF